MRDVERIGEKKRGRTGEYVRKNERNNVMRNFMGVRVIVSKKERREKQGKNRRVREKYYFRVAIRK